MSFTDQLIVEEVSRLADHDYLDYHGRRFQYVANQCISMWPDPGTRVLDVGRSHLSALLLEHYHSVWTLGFPLNDGEQFGHLAGAASSRKEYTGHIVFDLNDAQTIESIPTDVRFDCVVFAETIEHLYTAPELVLHALSNLLRSGGTIICQTPNATALHKRISLMLGRNPYERLRIDVRNRGHIREYTKRELVDTGRSAGLEAIAHEYAEYFGRQGSSARRAAIWVSENVSRVFPTMSRGQTIIFRKT